MPRYVMQWDANCRAMTVQVLLAHWTLLVGLILVIVCLGGCLPRVVRMPPRSTIAMPQIQEELVKRAKGG